MEGVVAMGYRGSKRYAHTATQTVTHSENRYLFLIDCSKVKNNEFQAVFCGY